MYGTLTTTDLVRKPGARAAITAWPRLCRRLLPDEIRQPGDGRGVRDLEPGAEVPERHPSLARVFSRPRKVSRARLPAAERVPPEILRLVTRQRMAFSEPKKQRPRPGAP